MPGGVALPQAPVGLHLEPVQGGEDLAGGHSTWWLRPHRARPWRCLALLPAATGGSGGPGLRHTLRARNWGGRGRGRRGVRSRKRGRGRRRRRGHGERADLQVGEEAVEGV